MVGCAPGSGRRRGCPGVRDRSERWQLVRHQGGAALTLGVDQIPIAGPTQIFRPGGDDRELRAAGLLDDRNRRGVEVAGLTARAAAFRIPMPFGVAGPTANPDQALLPLANQVVGLATGRACDLVRRLLFRGHPQTIASSGRPDPIVNRASSPTDMPGKPVGSPVGTAAVATLYRRGHRRCPQRTPRRVSPLITPNRSNGSGPTTPRRAVEVAGCCFGVCSL